jgi:hypothetical protein
LESEREVSAEEGAALAHKLGVVFLETSVKSGSNVVEAFLTVGRQLIRLQPPSVRKKKSLKV